MQFNKLYLSITLLLIGAMWVACVDVPNDAPTLNPTYIQSLIRFANFDTDVSTATPVSVDGANVGTLSALGDLTSYSVVQSGSRSVGFGGFNAAVSFGSEQQGTVYIHKADANGSRFLFLPEGSKYWNANPNPTVALVRFANVVGTGAASVTFRADSVTGDPYAPAVTFPGAAAYQEMQPGTYPVYVTSGATYSATLSGQQEVPSVNDGTSGGTAVITFGEGLTYAVTVPIDSVTGFYSAAHFHNAAAGSNGPIILPIFTSSEPSSIDFGSTNLTGASQPDTTLGSDTTHASGIVTCSFEPDGLHYTVEVTPGAPDTSFIMGHFHNAPEGSNGPVVRDIFLLPTDTAATFEGVWASSDVQPLTPALITALLNREIYVNIHSTAHPAGAIRAQLTVANPTLTFTGSWPDSAITQSFLNDLNAGNIYVNFHTTRNPGGQIRGQFAPDGGIMGGIGFSNIQVEGGKVYTVVSVGPASNIQLFNVVDQQGPGVQKPGAAIKSTTKSLK